MTTLTKLFPALAGLIAVAALLGAPHVAQAQGLTFAITGPGIIVDPGILNGNTGTVTVSGAPGDTLTFVGSLTNNSATDLTGLGITAIGDDPVLNFTPLPLTDLSLGTSETSNLFTITLPSASTPATYSFNVGMSGQDDTLSPVLSDDTYNINATVSAAPEPSGLIVLSSGLLALSSGALLKISLGRRRLSATVA